MLKSELGEDWRSKFKTFDEKPIAAASIGQVHKATMIDPITQEEREVAVKVQYPGIYPYLYIYIYIYIIYNRIYSLPFNLYRGIGLH